MRIKATKDWMVTDYDITIERMDGDLTPRQHDEIISRLRHARPDRITPLWRTVSPRLYDLHPAGMRYMVSHIQTAEFNLEVA